MNLHESWVVLVHGRRRREQRRREPSVAKTSPVEWELVSPKRKSGLHGRPPPPVTRGRFAGLRRREERFSDHVHVPTARYGEASCDLRDKRGDRHLFARR